MSEHTKSQKRRELQKRSLMNKIPARDIIVIPQCVDCNRSFDD